MKTPFLYSITLSLLGVFAGGCITVLFIIVPFWHSLSPTEVMDWFAAFGPTVGATMLPMEIVPLVLSTVCWFRARKEQSQTGAWTIVCISNALMILSFFVYFLPVNLSFLNHSISAEDVGPELERWELIHAARTILAVLSAAVAIKIMNGLFSLRTA